MPGQSDKLSARVEIHYINETSACDMCLSCDHDVKHCPAMHDLLFAPKINKHCGSIFSPTLLPLNLARPLVLRKGTIYLLSTPGKNPSLWMIVFRMTKTLLSWMIQLIISLSRLLKVTPIDLRIRLLNKKSLLKLPLMPICWKNK